MHKTKVLQLFKNTKNTQGIEGIDLITGTAYNECNCLSIQYYMDKKTGRPLGLFSELQIAHSLQTSYETTLDKTHSI